MGGDLRHPPAGRIEKEWKGEFRARLASCSMIASIRVCGLFPQGAAPVVRVPRIFQRVVFVLSVAIFAALGLGFALGEFGLFGVHAGGQQDGAYRQMRVYAEVLKKIQTDYVTEPNMNEVTTGALHGLLESLDADSSYLTPTEYKIYKDRPATGVAQVGLTVSKRYGYAAVVSVLPGSAGRQGASQRRRRYRVHRRSIDARAFAGRDPADAGGQAGKHGDALGGAAAQVRPGQVDADRALLPPCRRWPSSSLRARRFSI